MTIHFGGTHYHQIDEETSKQLLLIIKQQTQIMDELKALQEAVAKMLAEIATLKTQVETKSTAIAGAIAALKALPTTQVIDPTAIAAITAQLTAGNADIETVTGEVAAIAEA